MKEGFDKEIDSLLRHRMRRAVESRAGAGGVTAAPEGAHLDADELSAFAEGSLPAAARLAAVSHLADCEVCRGIVVSLTRVAAGPKELAAVPESKEPARPSPWRVWGAWLFAPRVLRLAVPALALTLVAGVSYVALRSNRSGSQQVASRQNRYAGAPREQANSATIGGAAGAGGDGQVASNNNNNAAPPDTGTTAAPPALSAPKGHGAAGVREEITEEAPSGAAGAAGEDAAAAVPPPPPPPAAASTVAPPAVSKAGPATPAAGEPEAAKTETKEKSDEDERADKKRAAATPAEDALANDIAMQSRNAMRSRAGNEAQMPDGSRNQKRPADNNASNVYGGGLASAAPKDSARDRNENESRSQSSRRGGSASQPEQSATDDEKRHDAETRSAAGHRFRRERSVWVDVNYKSSMPSTGVRRGTEPFRALVADLPVIERIADQLGGEFVVVVGGRAYHVK